VDVFNDARFFNCSPEAAQKWKPLVRALVDTDKTVFPDLLAKITTGPSANIFTNREHDNMIRSLNLRRLSFVLFIGERNHFLAQLPSIQEKLVEILKNPPEAVVQSEVYLCMRVLMCRLSPHNLSSFWPTVLTELFRVFEELIISVPAEGSEDLQIVLAASKFLDLLLVLQTQEFQIHQWMFVTDTVDAVYRPEDWSPESLLDQLAELVRDLPEPKNTEVAIGQTATLYTRSSALEPPGTAGISSQNLRRPMLAFVYKINHIRDLLQFFSTVSITSYESVYGSGSVDWEAVEVGLLSEMFEGRTTDEVFRG